MTSYPADIKRILRQHKDSFNVLYYNEGYSTPRENGIVKPAIVFCTDLTIYVLKKKDFKEYNVVALKDLQTIEVRNKGCHLTSRTGEHVEIVADAASMDVFRGVVNKVREDMSRVGSEGTKPTLSRTLSSPLKTKVQMSKAVRNESITAAAGNKPSTHLGANRLLIVKSMVDSDFRDCSALRAAYVRGTERDLQDDVRQYMSDNRKEMYKLCVHEHERFLNAIGSTAMIEDVSLNKVQEESASVSGVVSSVLSVVQDHKVAVTDSSTALKNLAAAHSELLDITTVLQMVHHVASSLEAQNYYIAVLTLQQLLASTRALRLPHKVMRHVSDDYIPVLRQTLLTRLKTDTNLWLTALREQSEGIGMKLMDQFGCKRSSRVKRNIVIVGGDAWTVQEIDEPAEIVNTFLMTEILPVQTGRLLQRTHHLIGQQEAFIAYIRDSRRRQFALELTNMHPYNFPQQYESWFRKWCGVLLTEDIFVHSFEVPLCTTVELHQMWETISDHITPLIGQMLDRALTAEEYTKLLHAGLCFLGTLVDCVRSAELYLVPMQLKLEDVRDKLVDMLAVEYAKRLGVAISTEKFQPFTVKNKQEYEGHVTGLFLQHHGVYKFEAFGSETKELRLPFTPMVPAVGQILAEFLEKVGALCQHMTTPDSRIVKHVELMLFPIPESLKRRAAGLGLTHSLQIAMLVVNASYFGFLTNVLEAHVSVISTKNTYGTHRFREPGPWLRDTFLAFQGVSSHLEKFFSTFFISRIDDLFAMIDPAKAWTPANKKVDTVNHLSDIVLFLDTMLTKIEVLLGGTALAAKYRTESVRYIIEHLSTITHQIGMSATNGETAEQVLCLLEQDAKVLVEYAERSSSAQAIDSFQTSLMAMHTHCMTLIAKEKSKKRKDQEVTHMMEQKKQAFMGVVFSPFRAMGNLVSGSKGAVSITPSASATATPRSGSGA